LDTIFNNESLLLKAFLEKQQIEYLVKMLKKPRKRNKIKGHYHQLDNIPPKKKEKETIMGR
jgi:ATP adenylyltransferase/5',5'''-P-1,P-4-tetraphosphate phosphorylase II